MNACFSLFYKVEHSLHQISMPHQVKSSALGYQPQRFMLELQEHAHHWFHLMDSYRRFQEVTANISLFIYHMAYDYGQFRPP